MLYIGYEANFQSVLNHTEGTVRLANIVGEHVKFYLLFDGMLSNLANIFTNNSIHSDKSYGINMRRSLASIVPSMSLVAKRILNQRRKGRATQGQKLRKGRLWTSRIIIHSHLMFQWVPMLVAKCSNGFLSI